MSPVSPNLMQRNQDDTTHFGPAPIFKTHPKVCCRYLWDFEFEIQDMPKVHLPFPYLQIRNVNVSGQGACGGCLPSQFSRWDPKSRGFLAAFLPILHSSYPTYQKSATAAYSE